MFVYCLNNPVNSVDYSGTCGYKQGTNAWYDCGRTNCPLSANFCYCVSMSLSFSGTLGPFVYGVQIALVTDSSGESEIQLTYYSPISTDALKNTPSADDMFKQATKYEKMADIFEFSLVGSLSACNAPSVSSLHGEGYQFGGSIGAGSAVSVDYNIVPNGSGNPYEGISLSAGLGSTDMHAVMGHTISLGKSPVSVFDLIEAAYNGVYGR